MKKILVLALAIVMALSVVALVACNAGDPYEGECHYANAWGGADYGCKVTVYVKDGTITKVVLHEDSETGWTRTTKSWKSKTEDPSDANHAAATDLGFTAAEKAYAGWFNKVFVGKSVDEVKAYVASATVEGQSVGTASANLVGATQSSARIIVAVQDALSKIPAAK